MTPQTIAAPASENVFLTDRQVAARFGVSRPTIWRWTKASDDFPRPVALFQGGTTRWRLADLLAWEAARPEVV